MTEQSIEELKKVLAEEIKGYQETKVQLKAVVTLIKNRKHSIACIKKSLLKARKKIKEAKKEVI